MIRRTLLAAAIAAPALLSSVARADVNVEIQPDGNAYTQIQAWGDPADKFDLVFIGDGFTLAEQAKFNAAVDDAVLALHESNGYSDPGHVKLCAFNIWRVNVVSNESGVDHPLQGIYKDTELAAKYGDGSWSLPERCITASGILCNQAADHAPACDFIIVLVNDTMWGGCAEAGAKHVTCSITPASPGNPGSGFGGIVTHELGHRIGKLADEYTFRNVEGDGGTYSGPEPVAGNLTKSASLAPPSKWDDLILPGTPIPTTVDNPAGVVGFWEGGSYCSRGIYRPQFTCQMRDSSQPFCEQCVRLLRAELVPLCDVCPQLPTGIDDDECIYSNPFKHFVFERRFRCRFPVPDCPMCPQVGLVEEIRIIVERAPEGTTLQVIDNTREGGAGGVPTPGGALEAVFAGLKTRRYDVVVSNESSTSKRRRSEFDVRVLRDGMELDMPAMKFAPPR